MKLFWRDRLEYYGLVSKLLHWSIGLLIIVLLVMGLVVHEMPSSPEKFALLGLHKGLGVSVLGLVLLRFFWRLYQRGFIRPHLNASPWQVKLAKFTHVLLYVLMFLVPLSGWLMSSAGGYPIEIFGFKVPMLMAENAAAQGLFHVVHSLATKVLMACIVLHVLGFLVHFFRSRSSLKRML